ncbi:MAG: hypothetical protein IH623_09410 [Verrucomicrobia bacterium]|nr:hypothetical protein [Verrucomicrobiota bacterium]
MKSKRLPMYSVGLCILLTAMLAGPRPASAATTNLFSTQFEPAEGYDIDFELVGQAGWLGEGSGGNGLVTNFIAGQGQQAYIGFFAPETNDDSLFLWRPLNFAPLAAGLPIVKFSVLLSFVDSANDEYDNFLWSVYNHQTNRLFTLDFDNYFTDVSYQLDGTNTLVQTGISFNHDVAYLLTVTMNFAENRWNARLGNSLLATNQPITTTNAALTLGDVDAVWAVFEPERPGDNFMLFDNYQVSAQLPSPPPPQMQLLGRTGDGQILLRVSGQENMRFAVDATTNWTHWTALKTNLVSGAYFDYVDVSAPAFSQRFYRVRWVP